MKDRPHVSASSVQILSLPHLVLLLCLLLPVTLCDHSADMSDDEDSDDEDDDYGKPMPPLGDFSDDNNCGNPPENDTRDVLPHFLSQHEEAEIEDLFGGSVTWEVEDDHDAPTMCSRSKNDLWHQFHQLPLSKDCPKRSVILELLIHASYVFMGDDYQRVADFLIANGIPEEDLLEHFYFNREWW